MDKREYLKELRDPPECVIDVLCDMDAREQAGRNEAVVTDARADAISKWQRAIDELIYRA